MTERFSREARKEREGSLGRAIEFQRSVNRLGIGSWDTYADHRAEIMGLLSTVRRRDGLCVLGAGNCNDLDLSSLVDLFGEVHLVDIDAEALGRGIDRVPHDHRRRIVAHGGVDLAACIDKVDDWVNRPPTEGELLELAQTAPSRIAGEIGKKFDVVLSSCLLSQLTHPLQNGLAMSLLDWRRLFNAIAKMHLCTIGELVRPEGTGVLACDVLSYAGAAVAKIASSVPRERLARTLVERIREGSLAPNPNPELLLKLLRGPDLAALAEEPRLSEPWVWDLGTDVQLVYGVLFTRPCSTTSA